MKFADRIRRLEATNAFAGLISPINREREGKSIIHLQIGEPDFDTPKNICDAAIKAIREGYTHYAPPGGVFEARQAAAKYLADTRHVKLSAENVVIMPGCKPLIYAVLNALIEAGDEVIVPDPGYPTYRAVVTFLEATAVPIRISEDLDFRFNPDDLNKLITPRTRMIILNSPSNPTGGVLTHEDLAEVYRLAHKHDLWILSDEIYSRMVYDTEFASIASVPDALDRSIIIDGLSKSYAMTGWRLGFAAVPAALAKYLITLVLNAFSSTATFTQQAMIEALTGPQAAVDDMVAEFQQRRDVMVDGLNDIAGVNCRRPNGAFYVFADIRETGMSSDEFVGFMLDTAGVACLSGSAFGQYGQGFVRFSYANSIENIQEALGRMKTALANTGNKT